MKKLQLDKFHIYDMEIKHLEMIHKSLREDIESFAQLMNDDEFTFDLKTAREIFALYTMEVNRNIHQISKVINQLDENAIVALNNDSGLYGKERIQRTNNAEMAKQYAAYEW